jgi:hypothetical protein
MVGRGSRMAVAWANTTMRAEPFVPDVPCPKGRVHILGHGSADSLA